MRAVDVFVVVAAALAVGACADAGPGDAEEDSRLASPVMASADIPWEAIETCTQGVADASLDRTACLNQCIPICWDLPQGTYDDLYCRGVTAGSCDNLFPEQAPARPEYDCTNEDDEDACRECVVDYCETLIDDANPASYDDATLCVGRGHIMCWFEYPGEEMTQD